MISVFHLLWIVPVSVFVGMVLVALFAVARDDHDDWKPSEDWYHWEDGEEDDGK